MKEHFRGGAEKYVLIKGVKLLFKIICHLEISTIRIWNVVVKST